MNQARSFAASLCILVGLISSPIFAQSTELNGLKMILARDPDSPEGTRFYVRFKNAGNIDLTLHLGEIFSNGRMQYADAVSLTLIGPAGRSLSLQPKGPPAVAGREDPFLLPLPSGAEFALAVDLRKYIAPRQEVWKLQLTPGTYHLQANYGQLSDSEADANLDMQGIALVHLWTGKITSQSVKFQVSKATR